jgi:hypothetical protein
VQLRIVHPVELPVHDVVAELHIVEDLGDAEQERPERPRGRHDAGKEQQAAGELAPADGVPDAADVARVRFAETGDDTRTQRLELLAEGRELLLGQWATVRHRVLLHGPEAG